MRCDSVPHRAGPVTRPVARFWRATARCLHAAVLLTPLAGCASTYSQLEGFLRSHEATESIGHYTVEPPDVLTIHSPIATEVDGVTQTVRPDGKVSLRLVGEVHVSGLTTEQIADKLETQLARYYVEPDVVVEVAGYRSKQYYVFGEVVAPGPKPFTGRDTLLKALADARPTFLAWQTQVRITRPGPDASERKVITVNLEEIMRTGRTDQNVLLQPGDVIEVPPTPLAWVGLRVRELLYPVEPAVRTYTAPANVLETNDTYESH